MLGHDVTSSKSAARPAACCASPFLSTAAKSVLRRELDLIEGVGVNMVFNTRVGFDLPLNDLASQFDAVFLSIGPGRILALSSRNGVEKRASALPFLESVALQERTSMGSRVAIIGGGNAPSTRPHRPAHGRWRHHSLSPRAQRHAAIDEEIQAAEDEGVRFVFLAAPHASSVTLTAT